MKGTQTLARHVPAVSAPPARFELSLWERRLLLFVLDLVALNLGLMVVLAVRLSYPWGVGTLVSRPLWYLVLSGCWIVCALMFDAYDLRRASSVHEGIPYVAAIALAADGLYLMIPVITPPMWFSRLTAEAFVLLTLGLVVFWRVIYATVFVQPAFQQRLLVLGAGDAARAIADAIREFGQREFNVLGFVRTDGEGADGRQRPPVLGTRRELIQLIERMEISRLVVAIDNDRIDDDTGVLLLECYERGIAITPMPALFEQLTGKVPLAHFAHNLEAVVALQRRGTRIFEVTKRLTDLAIGLLGLLVMIVLLPVVALSLAIESPGPLFYRQRRVGVGGREFDLLKFRTMIRDAEKDGAPVWAQISDQRVTRVGWILRRVHLDEVPQAISLIKGEMSFIGPRPERPEFVRELERIIPLYRARHCVKPGITGWAQVNHGYVASIEDAFRKVQYDLFYIKHRSLWLETFILAKTLLLVLTFRGR